MVRDDGRGFQPDACIQGNGLNNLRERAKLLGSRVRIESRPDQGTVVELTVRVSSS